MEVQFVGHCGITLNVQPGAKQPEHITTDILLDVLPPLDRAKYFENELPNKNGSQILTQIFVDGLLANIHMAHQRGYRDSADHLRYIIAELERGFASPAIVQEGKFLEK